MLILNLLLFCLTGLALGADPSTYKFPDQFQFGAATASYQVEGGWNADGKGENIWDRGTHQHPEKFAERATGDIACDSYHKYKEDVQMLKTLGVNYYRFSISWSRILPTGRNDKINKPGLDYYNNLINELLANNIQPYVTMFHWDLPQPLQDNGGWLNTKLSDYFAEYARVLFDNFGDRVKHWMTFNEIKQICEQGYGGGGFAPFISRPGVGGYQCTHIVLLAHGKTYRVYDKEFRAKQNGSIGLAIDIGWNEPKDPNSANDKQASEVDMQMSLGFYANPVIHGNWPDVMIQRIRDASKTQGLPNSRLPDFTPDEQVIMKGSYDFLGINHYSSRLVTLGDRNSCTRSPSYYNDICVNEMIDPSWPKSASSWLQTVPWGIHKLLVWVKNTYNNPPVLITENGFSDNGGLKDDGRANYHKGYLSEILKAVIDDKCNVLGYTAWSLMDNFEWLDGYTRKFGLYAVDFKSANRTRTRKFSSYVYSHIISTRQVDLSYSPKWPPAD